MAPRRKSAAKNKEVVLTNFEIPNKDIWGILAEVRISLVSEDWDTCRQVIGVLADRLEDLGDERYTTVRSVYNKTEVKNYSDLFNLVIEVFKLFQIQPCRVCNRWRAPTLLIGCVGCGGCGFVLSVPLTTPAVLKDKAKEYAEKRKVEERRQQYLALKAEFEGKGTNETD